MTQEEWDAEFNRKRLELQNDHGVPARRAMLRARAVTEKVFGERPPGPPGHIKLAVRAFGGGAAVQKLKSFWNWLNGKKVLIGSILVGVPVIWEALSAILAAGGVSDVKLLAIGGTIALVVGWAHKILKALGLATPPPKD